MFLSEVANLIDTTEVINLNKNKQIKKLTKSSVNCSFNSLLVIDLEKNFKKEYLYKR